ncbi:DUF202 domain-containing protein [Jiangella sp. DSM 45060]|uniref:DUF202 domain-containing protein n=1 Tax=Jiangella sp. DSM 45060 TaxID=1798224 RepID=UPI00087A3D24|nr:DUF202 domain-containing protein [Jiangella sp. DSM 45060]SDT64029.1 Uncharacterized membrane protein YidH, DUF202 family [Jiangella sp. DSM 45060]
MAERTYDHGAQNERTALAWTRTALALLVGVVLATRLAAEPLGPAAVVFGLVVAPVAVAVLLLARRRYRRSHEALHADRALPDGKLPALVALVTLLLAVLEIAYALG